MNDCLKKKMFPDILKTAQITPCHKKDDKGYKKNDGTVSILSIFFKVFERLILSSYMEPTFSRFLTGFRKKKHNAQHAFLQIVKNWKTLLNNKKNIRRCYHGSLKSIRHS